MNSNLTKHRKKRAMYNLDKKENGRRLRTIEKRNWKKEI